LLILILSGLLIININFFKYQNILNEYKVLLIFIFIISIITYKTALGRSDGPHIRSVTGLPLLLLCIITLNLIFDFILKNKKYLKIFQNVANFKNTLIFMFILLSIFFLPNLNFQNIISFKSSVKNYVNLSDEFFLTERQNLLIKRYNNLTIEDKCVLIFTYDAAIPYLLKKPSCNKYYFVWNIGNKKNQNLFIKSIENRKPNFILLGGDYKNPITIGLEPHERLPIIHNFIINNYLLDENVLDWRIYKLKSS